MTDEPENIVPVMLRRLDIKFDGMRDEEIRQDERRRGE